MIHLIVYKLFVYHKLSYECSSKGISVRRGYFSACSPCKGYLKLDKQVLLIRFSGGEES